MNPYKCPACDGWGKRVPAVDTSSAWPAPVPCPACGGSGVIWPPFAWDLSQPSPFRLVPSTTTGHTTTTPIRGTVWMEAS